MNEVYRVVKPHSDRNEHAHKLFFPGRWRDNLDTEYRDAIGRVNNGDTYRWLPFICAMDQDCPAKVLIRADHLDELADAFLEQATAQ